LGTRGGPRGPQGARSASYADLERLCRGPGLTNLLGTQGATDVLPQVLLEVPLVFAGSVSLSVLIHHLHEVGDEDSQSVGAVILSEGTLLVGYGGLRIIRKPVFIHHDETGRTASGPYEYLSIYE